MKSVSWIVPMLLLLSAVATAQPVFSTVSGRVAGPKGDALAEVVLTLTGETGGASSAVTSHTGTFRFAYLRPGKYTLICERDGFRSAVRTDLELEGGRGEWLDVVLDLTPGQETIQGTIRRAPLDPGQQALVTRFDRSDLRSGPAPRTLPGLLARVPGMVTDRVDVAGRFAGQPFAFQPGGTMAHETSWGVDGIVVTDYTRPGTIPFHFQPAAYDEIVVTEGAADLASPIGGTQVHFLTPTAGGSTGGEVSLSLADRAWEFAKSLPADLAAQRTATGGATVSPGIDRFGQYGARIGGPLLGPALTWTAAFHAQDVRGRTESGDILSDWLVHSFAKVSLRSGNSAGDLLVLFDEQINRQTPTWTLPQHNAGSLLDQRAPALLVALRLGQQFGNAAVHLQADLLESRQVATPRGAALDSAGHLGGNDLRWVATPALQLDANPYRNTHRRQFHLGADGEYLREGVLGGVHLLRLGASLVSANTRGTVLYPNQRALLWPTLSATAGQTVLLVPDFVSDVHLKRFSAFLGDTSTFGRFTVSLGVRYDSERAGINSDLVQKSFTWMAPGTADDGKALFSSQLGQLNVLGVDIPRAWKTISPRVSLVVDLDGRKGTLLRLAAGRYATLGQQALAEALVPNRAIEAVWNDDGDGQVEYSEVGAAIPGANERIDTVSFAAGLVKTQYDLDLTAPKLDELTLSLERAFGADLRASLSGFYRKHHHLLARRAVLADDEVETAANWVRQPDVTVNGVPVPAYARASQPAGYFYFNLPKAYDRFLGLQLGLTKKWSHRWSGRLVFVWQNWKKYRFAGETYDLNNFATFDGGVVASPGLGVTGSGALLNARWLANLAFRIGLPLGFQLSAALTARDGFPIAYGTRATLPGLEGAMFYEAGKKLGDDRLPAVWLADFALERSFRAGAGVIATLSAEVHNLTNSRTALSRQPLFGPDQGKTLSVVDQAVAQLSFRLTF